MTSPHRGWPLPRNLSHRDAPNVTLVITYRLADAVPSEVAKRLADELDAEGDLRYRMRIETLLDAGHGACLLRDDANAQIVVDAWQRFDGERYRLLAWVVMPNHIHVLIEPFAGQPLASIVQSWKSFTGRAILHRYEGQPRSSVGLWQREYWDRIVCDEDHYLKSIRYIHENPVAAGLCAVSGQWRWSSAYDGGLPRGELELASPRPARPRLSSVKLPSKASSNSPSGNPSRDSLGEASSSSPSGNPPPSPPSPPNLPPNRSNILTEQRHPGSMNLHALDMSGLVDVFTASLDEVASAMRAAQSALTAFLLAAEPRFLRGGRLIYLGAGTSGRLAVLDASEIPPTFQAPPDRVIGIIAGGDGSLRRSSEGKEDEPHGAVPELTALSLTANDLLVGIAAGGTTPYVLGALAWAAVRESEARPLTALISCAPVPQPPGTDHLIVLATGPEVVTGSTRLKAGTATKLALNTISTALMVRTGKVHENLMVDVRASNAKLQDRAARIVAELTGLPRPDCFELLDEAQWSVKTAVAMYVMEAPRDWAEAALTAANGHLHQVLAQYSSDE